jgi:hypothetical protein
MKVIVGGYTYLTNEKAEIGDTAVLPSPPWLVDVRGSTWKGEITAITSEYNGPCKTVIEIIKNNKNYPKQRETFLTGEDNDGLTAP